MRVPFLVAVIIILRVSRYGGGCRDAYDKMIYAFRVPVVYTSLYVRMYEVSNYIQKRTRYWFDGKLRFHCRTMRFRNYYQPRPLDGLPFEIYRRSSRPPPSLGPFLSGSTGDICPPRAAKF